MPINDMYREKHCYLFWCKRSLNACQWTETQLTERHRCGSVGILICQTYHKLDSRRIVTNEKLRVKDVIRAEFLLMPNRPIKMEHWQLRTEANRWHGELHLLLHLIKLGLWARKPVAKKVTVHRPAYILYFCHTQTHAGTQNCTGSLEPERSRSVSVSLCQFD